MHFPESGRRPSQSAERIETKSAVPESPRSGGSSPQAGRTVPSFAAIHESAGAESLAGRDGKALTDRVPGLPDVQASPSGGEALAAPLEPVAPLPPQEDPQVPDLAIEVPADGPNHGELADVAADGQVLHAGALIAEGNQGMVIVAEGDDTPGVFAAGVFASTAIVLRSAAAVAVSHDFTDPGELEERLLDCIDLFLQATGQQPSVTLAWNPAGVQERIRAALEGPVDDPALAEMDDAEREAFVQLTAAEHAHAIITLANSLDAGLAPSVIELPSAALFVPLEGAIDTFDEHPGVQAQWLA